MVLEIVQFNPERRDQDRRAASVPVLHERRVSPDRRGAPSVFGFGKLKEDVDRFDKKAQQAFLYALSPIPTARRLSSLPDSIEENNLTRAGLLTGMAAASFPGDFREMGLAFREGRNIFKDGLSAIDYKGQHSSTLFKGTFLEGLTQKYGWLKKTDKTLYSTEFGKYLRNLFHLEIESEILKTSSKPAIGGKIMPKFMFKGNYFQKLAGRTLMRIPVLGLIASSILEVPAIMNSVTKTDGNVLDKAKALGKQLIKSAGYVGFVNAGIAIVGAALIPYGYIAALIGMGIGGSLGLIASKELNKKIDVV